jgi:hypothetical protein
VKFNGGGGVAEDFDDDRGGRELGELVQRAESGGAYAEGSAQAVSDTSWLEVAAGGVAGKDPVAVGMRSGLVVLGFSSKLAEGLVEWWMQLYVSGSSEPDGDQRVGEGDVVPGQGDQSLEWLTEHEEKNGDGPVSHGQVGAVDVVADRLGLCLGVGWAPSSADRAALEPEP